MPSTIFSASLLPGYPLGDALRELTNIAEILYHLMLLYHSQVHLKSISSGEIVFY